MTVYGDLALKVVEEEETPVLEVFVGKYEPLIWTKDLLITEDTKPSEVARELTDEHYWYIAEGYKNMRQKTFKDLKRFKDGFTKDWNKFQREIKRDNPSKEQHLLPETEERVYKKGEFNPESRLPGIVALAYSFGLQEG